MPRFEESGKVRPPEHSEAQARVLECRPHVADVPRYHWPPKVKRANEDKPTLAVTCVKCGATVLAEEPVPKNLKVRLVGPRDEPAGTVEEGEEERGGMVVEEPEPQSPSRSGGGRIRAT